MKVIKVFITLIVAACVAVSAVRVMCFIYPEKYAADVKRLAAMYDVDEDLIFSVIKAESNFKPDAVSKKGAVGLMQIIPDTGDWAAERIGLEGFDESDLILPDRNIEIGVYYLSYLLNLYDEDVRCAVAAYNAGPTNVNQWLEDEKTLKDIPFSETEKYVKKVERNIKIYRLFY